MAANLSPEYREAEGAYKKARDDKERLACLREMLRTIPKHKGTEHLQADLKTRIKTLAEDLASPNKKGAARSGGPPQVVRAEGAAQIALVGAPNAGKSSLHARLTGSHAEVGPYPFTTQHPQPGMMPFENIHLQLVDLPPVSSEYLVSWMGNAMTPADACIWVVDLSDPACIDEAAAIPKRLAEKHVHLLESWDPPAESGEGDEEEIPDPFAVRIPTLLLANKADLLDDPAEELEVFRELSGLSFETLVVSAETGTGLEALAPYLFERLGIVRVYSKAPGRDPDRSRPFTLRKGQTIADVAAMVHKDVASSLKFARIWGTATFDGQQVSRDHQVHDEDVVELHAAAVQLLG